MWTLLNVPMINLSYSTNVSFPPKRGHPYNLDMFLVPKGVHIIGVPLYSPTLNNAAMSLYAITIIIHPISGYQKQSTQC